MEPVREFLKIEKCPVCKSSEFLVDPEEYADAGFRIPCDHCGAMLETTEKPKHPELDVKLSGTNGDSQAIMAKVRSALLHSRAPNEERIQFTDQAMASNYSHLIKVCTQWVKIS